MIFRGPYPDVAIPEVSLTDFIFQSANGIQEKPALIDGPTGRAWTYAQFADSARRTAASLAKNGFKRATSSASSARTVLSTRSLFTPWRCSAASTPL